MLSFEQETNEQALIDFVTRADGPYFQLPQWQRVKSNWRARLFCAKEDGKRVLTCLVLERKLPVCGILWYAPWGFVGDYEDTALIEGFAAFIRARMKECKAFGFVMDPPVVARIDGKSQPRGQVVAAALKKAGFGYNKDPNNYTYQPTMTPMIELENAAGERCTPEQLLKAFDKGVRYSVRVGPGRGLRSESFTYDEVRKNPEIFDRFLDVMADTTERLEVLARPREYYFSFLEQFAPWTVLDLVYYDKAADARDNEQRLVQMENLRKESEQPVPPGKKEKLIHRIDELEKACRAFEQRYEEACAYTDGARLYVAAGITITFGSYAGCVFGGTKNVLRNTLRSSHYLNFIRICRSIEKDVKLHDLGRVPHSYLDEKSPHRGLLEFKLSFNARLYEYIGEYHLVNRRFSFFLYRRLMPLVRGYRMRIIRFFKRLTGRA